MLDQSEIDDLLRSADRLVEETSREVGVNKTERAQVRIDPGELRRILHMRFPVLVNLAERKIPLREIVSLTAGSIIEFDQPSDAELTLMVGKQVVGMGQAVKIGEYFGIQLNNVGPIEDRIRAMGRR